MECPVCLEHSDFQIHLCSSCDNKWCFDCSKEWFANSLSQKIHLTEVSTM